MGKLQRCDDQAEPKTAEDKWTLANKMQVRPMSVPNLVLSMASESP